MKTLTHINLATIIFASLFLTPGTSLGIEVGDKAPTFDIYELHSQHLRRWQITAGSEISDELPEQVVTEGVIWQEPLFRMRAVTLDHTPRDCPQSDQTQSNPLTPVLAFAFEPSLQLNIRKDQLDALGLTPGPWLQRFKEKVLKGEMDTLIRFADRSFSVEDLAENLLIKSAGHKLAYATDLADTRDNHSKLTALAQNAHTLFCEASFVNADSALANQSGHLTTGACGAIGTNAAVEHLMPFHFSRRYQNDAQRLYQEVSVACAHTLIPHP